MPSLSLAALSFVNDQAAIDDDARWFAENPRRAHRVRPPGRGERARFDEDPSPPTPFALVAVRQLRPGMRIRREGWITQPPVNSEELAHALFDLLAEMDQAGGGYASPERVATRVAQMSAGAA